MNRRPTPDTQRSTPDTIAVGASDDLTIDLTREPTRLIRNAPELLREPRHQSLSGSVSTPRSERPALFEPPKEQERHLAPPKTPARVSPDTSLGGRRSRLGRLAAFLRLG